MPRPMQFFMGLIVTIVVLGALAPKPFKPKPVSTLPQPDGNSVCGAYGPATSVDLDSQVTGSMATKIYSVHCANGAVFTVAR